MGRSADENKVPGVIVLDYEQETATFYLGKFQVINGARKFVPERKYFQEADTNYEPLRIKQLPMKFSDLAKVFPRQGVEPKKEVPFFLPEPKFNKGARAYIRAKRLDIERKAMESNLNMLADEEEQFPLK